MVGSGPDKTEAAGNLYRAYERFAEVNEGQTLDRTPFGRRLNGMGVVKDEQRSKRIVYRKGACLNEVGKAYLNGARGLVELQELDRKDRLRVV